MSFLGQEGLVLLLRRGQAPGKGLRPGEVLRRPAPRLPGSPTARYPKLWSAARDSMTQESLSLRAGYNSPVSPTVFRAGPYRFYFFSREETRPHVHVQTPDGEAKFWISPEVELA